MIKQIYEGITDLVSDTYYGYKISAAYSAYGAGYDFCKFYSCGSGVIHIYNSSMVIDGNVDVSELEMFINMTKPTSVEMLSVATLRLPLCYKTHHRTLFRLIPYDTDIAIDDVKVNSFAGECYGILAESFENMGSFDAWYVDINHKIRHKVANLYLFDSTTATQQFNINGFVFLSHIATATAARGKGTARRLLYCLAEKYRSEGCNAYLWALDHRKTFYESIGFEPVAEDILYEMEG